MFVFIVSGSDVPDNMTLLTVLVRQLVGAERWIQFSSSFQFDNRGRMEGFHLDGSASVSHAGGKQSNTVRVKNNCVNRVVHSRGFNHTVITLTLQDC